MNNMFPPTIVEGYLSCFNSYSNGWKVPFLLPRQMAAAGLTYTGVGDRVKCLYCSIELDSWQPEDDPCIEHQSKSPNCAFFKSYNNQPGQDECGIHMLIPPISLDDDKTKVLLNFFNMVGIVHYIGAFERKEFSLYEDRLKTFEKCLLKMKTSFQAFVDAGFSYIGKGYDDHMSCFSCNLSLSCWEDDDDPWVEHANWSPNCYYVLLNRGKAFVQKICKSKKEKTIVKQKELSAIIERYVECQTSTDMITLVKSNTKRNIDEEKNVDVAEILAKIELKEAAEKQDPNNVKDSMLCKICYRNEIMVAFIPCCHVIACIDCALSMEQCAVCRLKYTFVIKIFKSLDKVEDRELPDCKLSQALDKPLSDKMLCKICGIDEMQLVFIPCRHIYACIKCGSELHECPVCSEVISGSIQVFL